MQKALLFTQNLTKSGVGAGSIGEMDKNDGVWSKEIVNRGTELSVYQLSVK